MHKFIKMEDLLIKSSEFVFRITAVYVYAEIMVHRRFAAIISKKWKRYSAILIIINFCLELIILLNLRSLDLSSKTSEALLRLVKSKD